MFDRHVLDAFEFGVESFKSLLEFKSWAPSVGIKPALVFVGEDFDIVHSLKRMKSLFIDLFHQKETEFVHLNNVEYAITFAAVENKVLLRTYKCVSYSFFMNTVILISRNPGCPGKTILVLVL